MGVVKCSLKGKRPKRGYLSTNNLQLAERWNNFVTVTGNNVFLVTVV